MSLAQTELPSATDTQKISRGKWMVLLAAFLGWMFDGLEMGIFPLIARPALIEMNPGLVGPELEKLIGMWNGRFNAFFLIGAACGGLLFGWLGDRLGRVRAMALSILTYSLFTGFAYFAETAWQLAGLRYIAALGMGGEWALGVALVMEVWPTKHRPLLAGVIGAAANVGFALIGIIAIQFPIKPESWRWVMLVGVVPALLTFVIRLFVPESERWKESVKDAPSQPIREIISGGLIKTMLLAIAFASIALIATWGAVQWMAVWADKLAGADVPRAKAYTQVLSAVGAIFGCLIGALIGGKFGRRPAYFLLCLGSLIAGSYMFRGVSEYGTTFLVMAFVVGAFTASFYGWLPLYLPELFQRGCARRRKVWLLISDESSQRLGHCKWDRSCRNSTAATRKLEQPSFWFMFLGCSSSGSHPRRKISPCRNSWRLPRKSRKGTENFFVNFVPFCGH